MAGERYDAPMSALTLVRDLRPQSFGKSAPSHVLDPIVEPMWSGVRVLAALDRSRGSADATTIVADEGGAPVEAAEAIEAALATAALADP